MCGDMSVSWLRLASTDIDWPFAASVMPDLAEYVDSAALRGMHVKMYFTLGQITNHMTELFALKSLGGEILLENTSALPPRRMQMGSAIAKQWGWLGRGPGQSRLKGMGNGLVGNEWLEEHMVTGYRGGWFTMNPGDEEDASIATSTRSRLLNYYISGQEWLYKEMHLGGLYYDGNDATRDVQVRIRRMTETLRLRNRTLPVFDVHGRAFDYVEELPFFDSMWTCEGIDFTRGPEYWLISIAAIPFGTFGEMLGRDSCTAGPEPCTMDPGCGETCANRWRGMLYGMTNRAGWTGHDPNNNAGIWRLWDEFQISDAEMYGYWNSSAPVKITRGRDIQILATSWVRRSAGDVLVAIGSWNPGKSAILSACPRVCPPAFTPIDISNIETEEQSSSQHAAIRSHFDGKLMVPTDRSVSLLQGWSI